MDLGVRAAPPFLLACGCPLGMFSPARVVCCPFDPNLLRVVGSLRRLVLKALSWSGVAIPPLQQRQPCDQGIRILCLDSVGVKGLFSALLLEAVMEGVRRTDKPNSLPDVPKPCGYFDLICGTSTSGLLAMMLGRLRMDHWWDAWWDKPWYSSNKLEESAQRLLEDNLSVQEKEELDKRNTPYRDAPLRPIYTRDDGGGDNNNDGDDDDDDDDDSAVVCRIFVCALPQARATSAAPLYFPYIKIRDCVYFDGGLASNNPILEAVREAGQEFPDQNITAVVSIGCGSTEPKSPTGGFFNVINSAVDRMTDTESEHNEFLEQFPGFMANYFQLQEQDKLSSVGEAE
ncbi:FabD/lysophospholipase-like protein [Thozetella sp. PMI_491]|nr:FabD/lysophospholipase-like protein [Thozetella sp. PMI_491]